MSFYEECRDYYLFKVIIKCKKEKVSFFVCEYKFHKTLFTRNLLSNCIHLLIIMHNYLGYSQLTTRISPHPPLKGGQIELFVQNVAQCSATNEKSIFRVIRFFFCESQNLKFFSKSKFLRSQRHKTQIDLAPNGNLFCAKCIGKV